MKTLPIIKLLALYTAFVCLQFPKTIVAQTLVLNQLCDLPSEVLETSGLEVGPNGCFWTHNDSQNSATVYCVDTSGVIVREVSITGDVNNDWEELAKDDEGNLYIGNFGNNTINRQDLRIVKVPSIDTCTVECAVTDTIHFTYPDQLDFPPNGDYGNFDMEAMFWYSDSLHLFSKDRSSPSTGYTKHYRLPTAGGTFEATLVDSIQAGGNSYLFSITAADISEDGSKVVLLNASYIWLITDFAGTNFSSGNISQLSLGSFTQKEAICFRDGFIYITDEQENFLGTGGKLYRVHPDVFVSVDESNIDYQVVYNSQLRFERIKLNARTDWKLLDLDGRLVQNGVSAEVLSREQLRVDSGMYVLQLHSEVGAKALIIKL